MATTAKIPATTQFGYLGDRLQVYLGNGSWRNPTAAEITAFKGSPTTYKQVNAQGRPLTIAQSTTQQQQLQAQAAEAQRRAQLTQQQQMAELQARQRAEALATQQRLAQEAAARQAEAQRLLAQQQAAAKPVVQTPVKQPAVQLPPSYTQPVAPPPVQAPPPAPGVGPGYWGPSAQGIDSNGMPYVTPDFGRWYPEQPQSAQQPAPVAQPIGQPPSDLTPSPGGLETLLATPVTPVAPTAPAMDPAWESAFAKWKANNAAWQQKFLAGNKTAQTTPITIGTPLDVEPASIFHTDQGINAFGGPVV